MAITSLYMLIPLFTTFQSLVGSRQWPKFLDFDLDLDLGSFSSNPRVHVQDQVQVESRLSDCRLLTADCSAIIGA